MVTIRPLQDGDAAELRRIHATPEVSRWWGQPEEGFPWSDEPDSQRFAIVLDGAPVGLIEVHEEPTPRYRHAAVDLFLDPACHGRGIGTEALGLFVRELTERHGHHRITIDPAVANAAAIRSYEKAGFKPVGVMRSYERDVDGPEWHDSLLMELLAAELPAGD
jgi:aminoglycoside 6'-N-acetyltransferase